MRVVALFLMLLSLVVFSVGFSTGCQPSGRAFEDDGAAAEPLNEEIQTGADGKALPLEDPGAAAPTEEGSAPK